MINVVFNAIVAGTLMTRDKFRDLAFNDVLRDEHGFARLAVADRVSNHHVFPSEAHTLIWPDWCTHVVWYGNAP
jgi:hypothetical protein